MLLFLDTVSVLINSLSRSGPVPRNSAGTNHLMSGVALQPSLTSWEVWISSEYETFILALNFHISINNT